MKTIKVGAVALNQTPMDWRGNEEHILQALLSAQTEGVKLLCLPELCITGYGCEDQFHSRALQIRALRMLEELSKRNLDLVFTLGLPILYRNGLYNCVALVAYGKIQGLVAKQHLAGDGLHYEHRWFKEWTQGIQGTIDLGFDTVPIGDLRFDFNGIVVGFEICEDAWVAERPGSHLSKLGVDIILNPSASHFAFGKYDVRKRFVLEGSRAFGVTYVYANLLGNEAGRAIYDGGSLIASGGEWAASGPRFSYQDVELTVAVIDVDATKTQQARTASFNPDLKDQSVPIFCQKSLAEDQPITKYGLEPETCSKFTEFSRAVPLALFDYMRKSHVKGFVISLSGGADSSACAVLVADMVANGVECLGYSKFLTKLGITISENNRRNIVSQILTCAYQGTENSSERTLHAAQEVAKEIGAKFFNFDMTEIVQKYRTVIETAIGRSLTWETDDIVLQNIQARVRAPSIWAIANLENKLLIATSNRSEAAVGYCTMDGDTAGCISPISGIDKTFLLEWLLQLRHNTTALSLVIEQQPTAELRPAAASQTDEVDLMPYEILRAIENEAILNKKSPKEVFQSLQQDFRHISKVTLKAHVIKFFQLWCKNQWKREKYALGYHVDSKDLDPRAWCRFPVLSSGFAEELAELASMA